MSGHGGLPIPDSRDALETDTPADGRMASPDDGSAERATSAMLRAPSAELGPVRLEWDGGGLDVARIRLREATFAPQASGLPCGTAKELELSTLNLALHLRLPDSPAEVQRPTGSSGSVEPWRLEPLDGLTGSLHATITDAALLFDARVKVPIASGQVDFNRAVVEHIGPNSRLGIGRMGVYVDAPGGRMYLLQFATPPTAGVRYEQLTGLLDYWTADRGQVSLRPFLESMLAAMTRDGPRAAGGFTAQARTLLGRTALRGELRPGDGALDLGRLQARLVGRAHDRNVAMIDSDAVGQGLTVSLDDIALEDFRLRIAGRDLRAGSASGRLRLRVHIVDDGLAADLSLTTLVLRDVRVTRSPA